MVKIILSCLLLLATPGIYALSDSTITKPPFWKEDFSGGKFPAGWENHPANDSSALWECTNQPFPGSYGRDQQAPPIASKSGGYHAQYASGKRVDRAYRKWEKAGIWPDAWLQTSAISCSGHNSVVLTFDQNFMWNDWGKLRADSGLFVSVSNDGLTWKEYDIRNGIGSEMDCPNPMKVELNISAIAANQPKVYLRFHWRGIFAWYWMIDDIQLSEALDQDLAVVSLCSHPPTGNSFTKEDVFRFKVVNLSARPVETPFDCFLQIDNRSVMKVRTDRSRQQPFGIVDTVEVRFPPADLTDFGIHRIKFFTSLENDDRKINDTLSMELYSEAYQLGAVTDFKKDGQSLEFSCNHARVRVEFCRNDIFRIQMAYDGTFTNPAGDYIVNSPPRDKVDVKYSKTKEYHLLQTEKTALRIYSNPLRFAMYKADNRTLVWEERQGLTYGKETVQYLSRGVDEYFYGGGMQNGRFSHRDKTILLRIDWNWEEGGAPNPAPFYMSTKGYGALRNTWAPGQYSFGDTLKLQHTEARFDCYYFAGNTLKEILKAYTDITGKPFLPPRWALGMGDANCYNRGDNKGKNTTGYAGTTPDVIPLIADKYVANDMPRGWILPNDGYGCGYTKLDSVVKELGKRGFHTGLWTENGVEKIAREVGVYGSRLCKLDVAWIGEGYRFGMDGCKAAYEGIENNSDARGFIWSVCGWAGTHRNSVVWTGDQKGNWDYIRWHIPTLTGAGLSAQNCATGDIDGIFGGSDKTFTRDLQWKCFTPVLMSMSGWAPKDKQPWVYGEPYTTINRKYLKLKMQLTPYMYTLCHEASRTGTPAVRALVLEYPDDPVAKGTETRYQFMLGQNMLIAPVYTDTNIRDNIYLPAGKWFDYWDGATFSGPVTLNGYQAPLEKLPVFIRSGAVIPMYTSMNYDEERPTDTLVLDIWPGETGSFELTEDEGSNRDYREGKVARTLFVIKGNPVENNVYEVNIGASKGEYSGKLAERTYILMIHSDKKPAKIFRNGQETGYSVVDKSGPAIFVVSTGKVPVNEKQKIILNY
jgi:alpha-glucosidase (family GH31 glycosyl hydrolase)